MQNADSELLTTEELASKLKLSPDTIKLWSRDGRIPTVWLSRTVRRFVFIDVMASLQNQEATQCR